jgi:hypothetical protein
MNRKVVTFALALAMMMTMACGALTSLIGSGTAGTVNDLWADVPPMDGMTKANLQLPLAAQIGLNAALQGKFNFIAFTTKKLPNDVQAFYTKDRMRAAGWAGDSPGCSLSTSNGVANGGICIFSKTQAGKNIALAVFMAKEDPTKDLQIFFARVEDDARTPTPGR